METIRQIEGLLNFGQHEAALEIIEEAKKDGAASGLLLFLEGVAYHRLERLQQAAECYQKALGIEPKLAGAWRNLAALCYQIDNYPGAVEALNQYREFVPYDREAYGWLVFSLGSLNRLQEAEAVVEDYRAVYPYDPIVLSGFAYVLEKQRRFINALLVSCSVGADSLATSLMGHIALASSHNLGNFGLSRQLLDTVYSTADRQANPDYLACLGDLIAMEGDLEGAKSLYRLAFEKGCSDPNALLNIALVFLASGDYEQGWKFYLLRSDRYKRMRLDGIPEWHGEALAGKTIIVHSEQGFGDVIQFIRYLPYLRATGAQVIFNTYPDVLQLLKNDAATESTIELQADALEKVDFQTYMMDFPALLRPRGIADFPPDIPYLQANPDKVELWRQKLASYRGARIGFVWRGNPDHFNDHNRSSAFSDFAHLGSIPGINWFSLQKGGDGESELGAVPPGMNVINLAAELKDFSDTAAVVSNLDLVICVDTSVAHLVGALGRECWLLLPAENQDWRWRGDPHRTPWYPQMRLFVQRQPRDWVGLMEEVVRPELAKWVLDNYAGDLHDAECGALAWHAGEEMTETALDDFSAVTTDGAKTPETVLATARWLAIKRSDVRLLARIRSDSRYDHIRGTVEALWAEWLLSRGDIEAAVRYWGDLEASDGVSTCEALTAWARTLIKQGDVKRAARWLEKGLQRFPKDGQMRLLAAKSLNAQGKKDAAIEQAEEAVRLSPRNAEIHLELAGLLGDKDRLRAGDHLQRALQLSLETFKIWGEIARFALNNRSPGLAVLVTQVLVSQQPSENHTAMLAAALAATGAPGEAVNILDSLGCVRSESWSEQYFVASVQGALGQDAEQEMTLRCLLQEKPDVKDAHFMLGLSLLRQGHCSEGWREYNLGLKSSSPLSVKEWSGEPLAGKSLLIYQDQGYGDLIQFFGLLRNIDPSCRITLIVNPDIAALVRLQGLNFKEILSHSVHQDAIEALIESNDFDYQIPFMKLPGLLGADLTRNHLPYPYLKVPRDAIAPSWLEHCAADENFKVGMVWAGNPHYRNDHHRSTVLDDWLPLTCVPGVSFYSFQKDAASSQAYACPQFAFKNIAADCDSLLATAGALQLMDLFISVDSGVAHLSAALGKETWILLPDLGTDFRWFRDREDCPWYPSVRLIRRKAGERWAAVLQRLGADLESRKLCSQA